MKPGPRLDALVTEKVMGFPQPRPYSTDIKSAWELVDKLIRGTKQWFSLEQYSTGVTAKFSIIGAGDLDCEFEADEITAPHAICMAALKAVGVKVLDDRGTHPEWLPLNKFVAKIGTPPSTDS